MPKIFTKKTVVITSGGGVPSGGTQGLLIRETLNSVKIGASESNAALSTSDRFDLNALSTEAQSSLTEAIKATLSGSGFNEANATQTEVRTSFTRYWASTTADNDASQTTPTNANGQPNSTNAVVKTNNAVGDLTNPVILTSTAFSTLPTTGTYASKKIRAFFNIPSRLATLDTILLQYNHSAGAFTTFYTHSGMAAVNNLTSGLAFDVSALTLAELATVNLRASYQANVVAAPETQVQLDAWCIEYERSE